MQDNKIKIKQKLLIKMEIIMNMKIKLFNLWESFKMRNGFIMKSIIYLKLFHLPSYQMKRIKFFKINSFN